MAPIFQLVSGSPVSHNKSGINGGLNDFRTQHPALFILAIIIYAVPTFLGLVNVICLSTTPQDIPYFHPIFLTDGILVCCCPLAAILPVVLWPFVLVFIILARIAQLVHRALQWVLDAPTFCCIRRSTIQRYMSFVVSIPGKIGRAVRGQRGGRKRRAQTTRAAPAVRSSTSGQAQRSYGTLQHDSLVIGGYLSPTTQNGQAQYGYQRLPVMDQDAASVVSAPPPYTG